MLLGEACQYHDRSGEWKTYLELMDCCGTKSVLSFLGCHLASYIPDQRYSGPYWEAKIFGFMLQTTRQSRLQSANQSASGLTLKQHCGEAERLRPLKT